MSRNGWRYGDEMKNLKIPIIHTMGYLINSSKDALVIAHSYDISEDGSAIGIICIPRGCVVSMKKLAA